MFSCGNDKRAGDVCYATCDANYIGIPSATCTSDLTWGPVQGACYLGKRRAGHKCEVKWLHKSLCGSTSIDHGGQQPTLLLFMCCAGVPPLDRGAPSESAIIGFASGGPSEIKTDPGGNNFAPMPIAPSFDRQSPKPLAVCPNNPPYTKVGPSNTTCKLYIYSRAWPGGVPEPGLGRCTAWFVQPDVMVTAGHCIKCNDPTQNCGIPEPLSGYNVNASDPGFVCCDLNTDSTTPCEAKDAWQVKAWASTVGWFGTEQSNDAAVILVEPFKSNTNTPVSQATKASDGQADIPVRTFFTDGYAGEPTPSASLFEGCTDPEFTDGRIRREWAPQTTAPLNEPTSQGQDLVYKGSICPGHSGGRLVDTTDSKAYGIASFGTRTCNNGSSRTWFTQLVDKALPDGAWLSSLVNAIKIGKPNYKWVDPTAQASCQAACAAIPGTGWRYINGGSPPSTQPTWALCASVLDLGTPYGKQWVTGEPFSFSFLHHQLMFETQIRNP